MIAAYEQSGLKQKAFVQREGVKFSTFTAWLMRYRAAGGRASQAKGCRIAVASDAADWAIEIALLNGIVIRTNEVLSVTALVGAVRSC